MRKNRAHIKLSKTRLGRLKKWADLGSERNGICPFSKVARFDAIYGTCHTTCGKLFPDLVQAKLVLVGCPCNHLGNDYVLRRVKEVIRYNDSLGVENKV